MLTRDVRKSGAYRQIASQRAFDSQCPEVRASPEVQTSQLGSGSHSAAMKICRTFSDMCRLAAALEQSKGNNACSCCLSAAGADPHRLTAGKDPSPRSGEGVVARHLVVECDDRSVDKALSRTAFLSLKSNGELEALGVWQSVRLSKTPHAYARHRSPVCSLSPLLPAPIPTDLWWDNHDQGSPGSKTRCLATTPSPLRGDGSFPAVSL